MTALYSFLTKKEAIMKSKLFQKTVLFFFFTFVLAGCGGGSSPVATPDIAGANEESGAITVSVNLSSFSGGKHKALLKHTTVTRVSVTITKEPFSATQDLKIQGGIATGTFTQLGLGEYDIAISVYAGTELLANGWAKATVGGGTTTVADIVIPVLPDSAAFGSLAVNITVVEIDTPPPPPPPGDIPPPTDDGIPAVTLSVGSPSIGEFGGTLLVTATLSQAAVQEVIVTLSKTGTATENEDYTLGSTIIIPAGEVSKSIMLAVLADAMNESDETVIININTVTNAVEQGVQERAVIIVDDDL